MNRGSRSRWTRVSAAVAGLLLLLWLDGWFSPPEMRVGPAPPRGLHDAVSLAAGDLARRAAAFSSRPQVARSLQGGGIAVDRAALFAAARDVLEGAAPGSWISLTDREGNVHAWWGDAPSPVPQVFAGDGYAVLWSASTVTLAYRRSVGVAPRRGVVSVARLFPADAPEFGRSLGLDGEAAAWRPVAADGGVPLFRAGDAGFSVKPAALPREGVPGRDAGLIALVLIALISFAASRGAASAGLSLVLLYLALFVSASGAPRVLATRSIWPLAVGVLAIPVALAAFRREPDSRRAPIRTAAGWGLFLVGFLSATAIRPPELTTFGRGWWHSLLEVTGAAALVFSALALGASGRHAPRAVRPWTTLALLVTTVAIVASLAFVTGAPEYPAILLIVAAGCFELWTRAAGPREERYALPRLFAASAFLLVLLVSPGREHERMAEAFRVASAIRLPDPEQPSTSAVAAAQQAADRIARFDLASDLPAPPDRTDLSDLAYRLWRGFAETGAESLVSFEVRDADGRLRSRFSPIPEPEAPPPSEASTIRIDRYELAVVRRTAPVTSAGVPWGSARVEVVDWPTWDPLPPRIGVYRRLVLGERMPRPGSAPARPLVAAYALDGAARDEGPPLEPALREALRRSEKPQRTRFSFRGGDWCGEIRPLPGGYRLVALPVPTFFGRLLTAALLLPDLLLMGVAALLLLLARSFAGGQRSDVLPAWIRTFRGRLVALFVAGVLVPLFAVTFFLRGQVETRAASDTFEHARTALVTARRVLDDYLPSAGTARGRLRLLDDALLAWLANAVGYDLSVYDPEGTLVATSRRDLYASGLVPDRAPASAYVTVGLQGAAQQTGSRELAGSRFEEVTTALSAIPGVRGLASPGLLSLLLLPQQEIAAAEAEQLTAAVWAFSLLTFLLSAGVAARLAVRVAKPVADLVEGTRAVARGDFSPRLEEPPDEELKELVRAFLSMSQSLKTQTEAVSREKERLATLLSHLTAGVVALGEGGRILLANPAAVALGGGSAAARTVDELFPGDALRDVRAVLRADGGGPSSAEVEPRPGERWRIVSVPLPQESAGDRMAVIEDVSDVVRSNRLAAWAEMARIIAHEIKNPLTPIRLSVEHLREVWRRGSPEFGRVLEDCVANVLRQTDELRRSASEFSDYSRLPEPRMEPVDLALAVREAAAAFAGAPGIRWRVSAEPGTMVEADPRLLARVFANLVGNAVEALGVSGGDIALSARRDGDRIRVSVEDDGPGVAPAILPRLFEPYFSARSGGTGLGLAIVKKILEEHGGSISAHNRKEGGFRVEFDLPVSRTREAAGAASTAGDPR